MNFPISNSSALIWQQSQPNHRQIARNDQPGTPPSNMETSESIVIQQIYHGSKHTDLRGGVFQREVNIVTDG